MLHDGDLFESNDTS